MQQMVREVKGFSGPDASADAGAEAEQDRIDERPGRPQPLARSVVATRHEVETFGKLLVSEAYQRRFPAAARKAFVADGSDANWGVWRRHFSHYVPILDFIHALRNQQSRMDYPAYRKQGLPMTSTYVESTVKQINRRMKGTEKFWSHGVEPMLTLVADHLSDTPTLSHFWRNRPHRLTGSRCYQSSAA